MVDDGPVIESLRVADAPSPTRDTVGDAERGLALGFVSMRLGTLALVGVGVFRGWDVATHRTAYLLLSIAITIAYLVVCRAVWRRGEVTASWGWTDLAISLVGFVGQTLMLPASTIVGDWAAWGGGLLACTVVAVGAWTHSIRRAAVVCAGVMVAYLLVTLSLDAEPPPVLLANAVVYPIMGITASIFIVYLRGLARAAEQSHREAIESARQIELDRYRLLVHDATGILRLLGAEDTPREMLPALRRQSKTEATRLRRYLADPRRSGPGESASWTLGRVVDEAVEGFWDLPLEIATDLGSGVPLAEGNALALQRALATILHNIRRHAQAHLVVIHADSEPGTWILVIRDDGVGFDLDTTPLGYGLGVQVFAELERQDMVVDLRSRPGAGTTVTVTGTAVDE